MPDMTPTGAVDVVERQVRRVRRRKNLYELQAALYWTIVSAGLAAICLLPLALFAPADVFATAAWSTLAALLIVSAVLLRAARRRWLGRAAAIGWIEARSAVAGRVRTLLELGRLPAVSSGFFHPLLVAEVHATLPSWMPPRLVPRQVPGRALACAIVVVVALVALVRAAALFSPTPPPPGVESRPSGGRERTARAGAGGAGDRIVTAPAASARPPQPSAARGNGGSADSPLTQYSSALQENVRERVWGKAWERVREALARAGTSGSALNREDAADEEIDATGADDRAVAGRDRRSGKRGGDTGEDAEERDADHDGGPSANAQTAGDDREGGASGAGNGTSPADLFSGSAVDTADGDASFELSLAARMRSDKAGRRQAGGAPPDADPDTRPALADDQRREAAAHRMTVPAAYEQVVREVFAHREEP
jgi:hypothetical protein